MSKHALPSLFLAATIAMVPLAASPALALTPASEFRDVSPDHWAYNAIQALVEKYQVMEGFPDRTFRGTRTVTRYELAAALAKVLARTEEMMASATGAPLSMGTALPPEDLRTIARLQREFRDELEVLRSKVELMDSRLGAVEKRLRWGGTMVGEYRDFLGASPIAASPLADFRLRTRLNLDAALSDDLSYAGSLFWDVYGPASAGNAFAVEARPDANAFTESYIFRSFVSYKPRWASFTGGLVNVSEALTLGSTLRTPFNDNIWREGLGGYGFVGTPGLDVGGTLLNRVGTPGGAPLTNPVWWLPGTDVAFQALDPNATQPIFPNGAFTAAASTSAGPFSLGAAAYLPNASGRNLERLTALNYPGTFPTPERFSPRALAALGADFGFVRAQVAAKTPGAFTDGLDQLNKTVTGTVDVGSDALGLSLQAVSRTAFTGNFTPTQASATLASNDLFGTGFGLGLAGNAGTAAALAADGTFQTGGRSLLQGLAGADYVSYGLVLGIPGFSVLPRLTLAAQQTAGAGLASTIGSGLTLQGDLQLFELPTIRLGYSMGKFDPLAQGGDNGLLNNASQVSHEQLTAQLVLPL